MTKIHSKDQAKTTFSLKPKTVLALSGVLVLIGMMAFNYFNPFSSYDYAYTENNVTLYSNGLTPLNALNDLSIKPEFVLVARAERQTDIQGITNFLTLFSEVGTANGKKVTAVIETYDQNLVLVECNTNKGQEKGGETLPAQECRDYVSSLRGSDKGVILLDHPEKSLNPYVIISPGLVRIVVRTKTAIVGEGSEVEAATMVVLRHLYSNTDEVLKKVARFSNLVQQR